MSPPTEFPPLDELREGILREAALSSGASGAEEESGSVRSFLVFQSGKEWYAADLANIRRVLRPGPIARVSGAAPEVLGLMNYQGEVLCVLDLQRVLGCADAGGERGATEEMFVVVLHYEGKEAGFLVDSVEDVWDLPSSSVLPVLESLDPSRARMFEGTVANGGRFAGLLSPSMCLNP
jgi:purine-binding chemotaxis protein CheW